MSTTSEFKTSSDMVNMAKGVCRITTPNEEMTDKEIAEVCRYLGSLAPDAYCVDGTPFYGRIGVSTMLSIALYEFPDFYDRHQLSQYN